MGIGTLVASAEQGGIMGTLGIDVKLIIFQIIAFILLVIILGKWVFPVFFKIIDARQAAIEESNKAALHASKQAQKAEAEVQKLLAQARTDAKGIVATAKDEAAAMVNDAEQKGKVHAERIVVTARQEIEKEVIAAKKALHNETIELVAQATEKVVGGAMTASMNEQVITKAIEESK